MSICFGSTPKRPTTTPDPRFLPHSQPQRPSPSLPLTPDYFLWPSRRTTLCVTYPAHNPKLFPVHFFLLMCFANNMPEPTGCVQRHEMEIVEDIRKEKKQKRMQAQISAAKFVSSLSLTHSVTQSLITRLLSQSLSHSVTLPPNPRPVRLLRLRQRH